jgi:hypothetical protein
VDPETRHFEAGHFSMLADQLGGGFLKLWLFAGSVACFVGARDDVSGSAIARAAPC